MRKLIKYFLIGCMIISYSLPEKIQSAGKSELEIVQISDETIDRSLPEVQWVGKNIKSILKNKPLFTIKSNDSETAANGWVGINKDEIIIRVVITDDYHINNQSGPNIYDGDAIQFGIDANGDGNRGQEKNMAYTGPGDASITVALTPEGPKAWAHYYGHPDGAGAFTRIKLDINRNDEKQTTTYDIRLPWEGFQTLAGISPYIGLAFQINDTDKGPKQKRIYWGDGAGGNLRPGLFKRLRIGKPNESFMSIHSVKNRIWTVNDKAEVIVAINSKKSGKIYANYKNYQYNIEYSGSKKNQTLQRYSIFVKPGELISNSEKLLISIKRKNKRLQSKEIILSSPDDIFSEFQDIISQQISTSPHPLYTKHLMSLKAIINDEWNKSFSLLYENPVYIQKVYEYITDIVHGLKNQKFTWSDYENGRTSLLMSFVSGSDRSLQFYRLTLPVNWDKNKTYPLIMDLHGSGSPYALDFFIGLFRNNNGDNLDNNVNSFIVAPWGRGNFRYHGVAESDVWDVMNDAKKMFNIDESQQYLTGFSMGGYGTWMLSAFVPEHWAAIAICSGGDRGAPSEFGFAENIAKIPVLIWHGEKDGTVPVTYAYNMQTALEKAGNKPQIEIIPDRGHNITKHEVHHVYDWLLSHTRPSLKKFTYMASSRRHNGRNGVEIMDLEHIVTDFPKLDVDLIDNRINIKSTGTSKIKVNMGKNGLGLSGEVMVMWNGKQIYQGPVTEKVFNQ